jgi:hypothetical protein
VRSGEIRDGTGERGHAAVDIPDPRRFGAPDQREDRRAQVGRAADVGGETRKKLREARIGEGARRGLRQRPQWRHRGQEMRRVPRHRARHAKRGRMRVAHHRPLEGLEQEPRPRGERAQVRCRTRTREFRDRGLGLCRVGEEIERRSIGPDMPRQHLGRDQGDVVAEARVGFRKEFLEHGAHREDRRAGIDRPGGRGQLPRLATNHGLRLEKRHLSPGGCERERGGEPGDAAADHDDAVRDPAHGRRSRRGAVRDAVKPASRFTERND